MFENEKCQYCGEDFCKNDDIVVCPECGSPFHRKCWEEHGKCVNEDKHKLGYVYNKNTPSDVVRPETEDFIGEIKKQISEENGENKEKSDSTNSANICEQCGAQLIDGSDFCVYCGHKHGTAVNPRSSSKKRNGKDPLGGMGEEDEIMGEKARDIALVVRTGSDKFLPKFRKVYAKKSKISWSWPSFFFGYLYLFFRKLYKYGIVFIIAQILIFNVVNVAVGNPIGKMQTRISDIYTKYTSSMSESEVQNMSQSQYNQIMKDLRGELMNDGTLAKAYIPIGASLIATNIVCALFFNFFYLKRCTETIGKMKKSADMLGGMSESEYKFNLMARGGVSLLGLFLGYFVKMGLEYMLSYILELFVK